MCSTADAVVSTEGGAVSMEPFAIDDGTDGVVVEVVHGTSVLLAYHIDVTLQDELDTVFVARGSRLAHDDVAHLILLVLDTVVLSELLEEAMIFSSFFEGRGTCVISWKYFQTILGFSSVISIALLDVYV